jgi:hypothetical protein
MCTFRLGFKVSTGTDSCRRWAATLRKQRLELPARWARSRTNAAITSMSTDENTGERALRARPPPWLPARASSGASGRSGAFPASLRVRLVPGADEQHPELVVSRSVRIPRVQRIIGWPQTDEFGDQRSGAPGVVASERSATERIGVCTSIVRKPADHGHIAAALGRARGSSRAIMRARRTSRTRRTAACP